MKNGVYTGIFSLVQIFVAMNPDDAVYYANPGPNGKFNPDFYFHWENFNNEPVNNWKEFCSQVLSIPMAHELIGFYTIPDDSDGVLKVMRSYQYFAASAISNRVSNAKWTKEDQHGGYIWHTTGSGKTMTSFKAAQLIANSRDADKVVFLLDRIELGDQSLINYRNFADPSESVQATEDTQVLISKLKSNAAENTLIVTSIQKMSRINDDSNIKTKDIDSIRSKRIVFIIDECHRDQKGEMHQAIKRTFPNAMYFGFTGTPDNDYTADIFGDELHRYTIVHGIRDKNVLGFDPYKVCTFDDKELRKVIGLEQCHCKTEEEAMSDPEKREVYLYYLNRGSEPCDMLEIESFIPKSQYNNYTNRHQNAVVKDILNNWLIRSNCSQFHAIFATSSISEAINYYKLFKTHVHNLKITAIFDPSDDNDYTSISKMNGITEILTDYQDMFGISYTISEYQNFKKDACARLAHKKPYVGLSKNDQIDLVIVVDQLLTGFDSKWINTLYLDKKLYGKNFIQAISRTNRLYGPEKPHGTIVWYRYPHTMESYLEDAVDEYSGNCPFGVFVDKLKDNIEEMNSLFSEITWLFESEGIYGFEYISDELPWRSKFASLFSDFNSYLISAKVQGFNWKQKTYDFRLPDGSIEYVDVDIDEITYLILVERYKELFSGKTIVDSLPYDINTHITEIKTDTIDDDYMNSKFDLYLKNLSGGDEEAKENALNELHKTFATLSQEDQKYAKQFLHDIESGNANLDASMTFRDYITEYKTNAFNDNIHKLSQGLGIDESKLRILMGLNISSANINEFGRFDDLMSTLDIDKTRSFFEQLGNENISNRKAKLLADELLRKFIIDGGFDL